ncbi:MAG: hypothetical protein R3229_15140 [Alphaproteobacteria bacterium]|nr:hypothetical protein [Alphaproteobacteria bacterium]
MSSISTRVTSRTPYASLTEATASAVDDPALAQSIARAPALAHQARALARLIDDLLTADLRPEDAQPEADGLSTPRLPGDNPDDALRYLLRGLRGECRDLQAWLHDPGDDRPAGRRCLTRFQRTARAAVQALAVAPESGAGAAITALVGGMLDTSGLLPWWRFIGAPAPSAPGPAAEERVVARRAPMPGKAPRRAAESGPGARPRSLTPRRPAAAARPGEDPLEIPLMLVRPSQGDWARELFARGVGYLAKVTGEPPEKLRDLVDRWLDQAGNDPRLVFRLLAKAQRQNIADPKAWVSDLLHRGEGAESAA